MFMLIPAEGQYLDILVDNHEYEIEAKYSSVTMAGGYIELIYDISSEAFGQYIGQITVLYSNNEYCFRYKYKSTVYTKYAIVHSNLLKTFEEEIANTIKQLLISQAA
jgi:hypothetical protein